MTFVPTTSPKVIIRLHSAKKDKFRRNVLDTISEAAKTQLTSRRPAAVMVHVEFNDPISFARLSQVSAGSSQFDTRFLRRGILAQRC
jgi:hypothetical protein